MLDRTLFSFLPEMMNTPEARLTAQEAALPSPVSRLCQCAAPSLNRQTSTALEMLLRDLNQYCHELFELFK
mgnify:CR=1 FL=1